MLQKRNLLPAALLFIFTLFQAVSGASDAPPGIDTVLKPPVFKKMVDDKEVVDQARLEDDSASLEKGWKNYSFYTAMLVGATLEQTREVLTDYRLYSKVVPYVDKTEFDPKTHVLEVDGGIWGFRLHSWVHFEEKGDRWIKYRIVNGHFRGLEGEMFFQSMGEKGTAVYFSGSQRGRGFPPQFVIERGAEIVFGFTARHMRSYIEAQKAPPKGTPTNDRSQVPEPRGHL